MHTAVCHSVSQPLCKKSSAESHQLKVMKTWPRELPFCAQSECVPTLSMESITTDPFSVCHCHCCWLNKPTRLPRHTVWFCLYISSSPFRALWAYSVNVAVFCMLCTLRWHITFQWDKVLSVGPVHSPPQSPHGHQRATSTAHGTRPPAFPHLQGKAQLLIDVICVCVYMYM